MAFSTQVKKPKLENVGSAIPTSESVPKTNPKNTRKQRVGQVSVSGFGRD